MEHISEVLGDGCVQCKNCPFAPVVWKRSHNVYHSRAAGHIQCNITSQITRHMAPACCVWPPMHFFFFLFSLFCMMSLFSTCAGFCMVLCSSDVLESLDRNLIDK